MSDEKDRMLEYINSLAPKMTEHARPVLDYIRGNGGDHSTAALRVHTDPEFRMDAIRLEDLIGIIERAGTQEDADAMRKPLPPFHWWVALREDDGSASGVTHAFVVAILEGKATAVPN